MIVVVGSINADLAAYLPRWPHRGETIAATRFAESLGGKGANQAVAAARLGGAVRMAGAVGADSRGAALCDAIEAEGVSLQVARLAGTPTGLALIDIGPDGDNVIRLVGGANAAMDPNLLTTETFADASLVLLQNEVPLAVSLAAAKLGRAAGARVIMDPAPAPDERWSSVTLGAFDVLTPNAMEAALFTGAVPANEAEGLATAAQLAALSGHDALVTMGAAGVAWCAGGVTGFRAAYPIVPVDTVAAGDCFNGALAVALSEGQPFDAAVAFAAKAAAHSTQKPGGAASLPNRADMDGL